MALYHGINTNENRSSEERADNSNLSKVFLLENHGNHLSTKVYENSNFDHKIEYNY